MKRYSLNTAVLFLLLLSLFHPRPASAAVSMTDAAKAALDKTSAQASAQVSQKLAAGWNELAALQTKDQQLDVSITEQHYRNADAEAAARKQMKLIDAALIAQLTKQLAEAKSKYQPLFDAYSALTQQITLARKAGLKETASLLRTQQDGMKVAVTLARANIRAKQTALTTAKEQAAKKIKAVRTILDQLTPIETKIKTVKSTMKVPKANLSTAWSNFLSAARKSDAANSLAQLTLAVSLSNQLVLSKQQMLSYEQQISRVIQQANSQILRS